MGTTTPNIGIYIPSAGETNYDSSFLAGMLNVDQHDHSGPPTKGVPLSSSGIADGSITRNKLNANVVLAGGGLAVDVGSPNALKVDGVLLGIYNIATNGIIVRTGSATAVSRSIVGTANEIDVSNGDGVSGNPQVGIADDPVLPGTGAVTVPIGTTAQRPGTPVNGMYRYNSDTARFEGYENGVWIPVAGTTILQKKRAEYNTYTNTTTTIPFDDSIPQQTEGVELFTLDFTPIFATSSILIECQIFMAKSAAGRGTVAIFRDAAADAVAVGSEGGLDSVNEIYDLSFSKAISSAAAALSTFKFRVGTSGGGTLYINGNTSSRRFGGLLVTSLTLTEFIPGP